MADGFKKIAKGILIGGGTILSLFAPAIGAPLIVAGTAINTGQSADVVNAYGQNLNTALGTASAMGAAGNNVSAVNFLQSVVMMIKTNLPIIILIVAGFIFLPKFLRRKR